MGRTLVLRIAVVAGALGVAFGLTALERDSESCDEALRGAYSVAQAPAARLDPAVEQVVAECTGSDPLMRLSLGLVRVERDRQAVRLARVAAQREPESYYAWAVLALTEPPPRAAEARERADGLNPIAARRRDP